MYPLQISWEQDETSPSHPFMCLSACSHTLRIAVEMYSLHLLKTAASVSEVWSLSWDKFTEKAVLTIDEWKDAASWNSLRNEDEDGQKKETILPLRRLWIIWCHEGCFFCGKPTARRAVFDLSMWCCRKCDDRHFGPKLVSRPAL
jgi:hypothetical protein